MELPVGEKQKCREQSKAKLNAIRQLHAFWAGNSGSQPSPAQPGRYESANNRVGRENSLNRAKSFSFSSPPAGPYFISRRKLMLRRTTNVKRHDCNGWSRSGGPSYVFISHTITTSGNLFSFERVFFFSAMIEVNSWLLTFIKGPPHTGSWCVCARSGVSYQPIGASFASLARTSTPLPHCLPTRWVASLKNILNYKDIYFYSWSF